MPIYEYRCATCGFEKEYLQKMSDAPLTDCPECGKSALVKMVSAAGFHLKGSGWYVTDFKHGAKPKSKPDGQSGTKPEADAAANADGEKPAAKTAETVTEKSDAKAATETPSKKSDDGAAATKSSKPASSVSS